MYITVMLDVEDTYYPPECRLDEITVWMADILAEYGIRGSFYFHGDHLRQIKGRGNREIGRAMMEHDAASHGWGNVHPVIPEILEKKGWNDGVEAMCIYEDEISSMMEETLGKMPVALSRHHFFTAQHVAVAGERNLPYMFSILPDFESPVWFCGGLNFPYPQPPASRWFDISFCNDIAFMQDLAALDKWLRSFIEKKTEYMTVFVCHPARCMVHGWMEHYCMANGRQKFPKDLGWLYALRSDEELAKLKANFRRLAEYLSRQADIQIVGVKELGRIFSFQPAMIPRSSLIRYAGEMSQSLHPLLDGDFSPAEISAGLAESLIHLVDYGYLPASAQRRDILGPVNSPVPGIEKDCVTFNEIIVLSRQLVKVVEESKHLPANLLLSAERVSIGQYLSLASKFYTSAASGEKYELLINRKISKYPEYAGKLDTNARYLDSHPYLKPDFRTDDIALHLRLQTWTIKPARISGITCSHVDDGIRAPYAVMTGSKR